jgi:hypothetical protein
MSLTFDKLLAFVGQHTALTDIEARSLCEQALRPEFWISLCDWMTISSTRSPVQNDRCINVDIEEAIDDYRNYGHCIVDEAFARSDIECLRSAVTRVHEGGWPMIFAFLYDQFWTLTQSPKLDAFAKALLGLEYQPTISFWVNYVPAQPGSSGFPPHLDDVRPGHHAVTCWIPLTLSTPDNGCVYVVEQNPHAPGAAASLVGDNVPLKNVLNALLHVRALPAKPGSFLAWPNNTLHWGGMFLRGEARLSLSYHLTGADYDNIDPALRLALIPDQPLPSFEQRLRWVSRSMLRFRARDPLLERFAPLARYLAKTDRRRSA